MREVAIGLTQGAQIRTTLDAAGVSGSFKEGTFMVEEEGKAGMNPQVALGWDGGWYVEKAFADALAAQLGMNPNTLLVRIGAACVAMQRQRKESERRPRTGAPRRREGSGQPGFQRLSAERS
jgi:hypothetical protein